MAKQANTYGSDRAINADLENLLGLFQASGVDQIFFKRLAPNDNSKNQVYLAGHLNEINWLPRGNVSATTCTSKKTGRLTMNEDAHLNQNKVNPRKLFYVLSIGWSLLVLAGTLPKVLKDFSNWKHRDEMAFISSTKSLRSLEWQSCQNSNPISVVESEKLKSCLNKNQSGPWSGRRRDMCRNFSIGACIYVYGGGIAVSDEQKEYRAQLSKMYKAYPSIFNKTLRWLSYTRYSGLFWVMIFLLIAGPLVLAFGPTVWFFFKKWLMD